MDATQISRFLFSGKATFTLTSVGTGTSYTYRVNVKNDCDVAFVSVLSGPDVYRYAGIVPLSNPATYRATAKSKIGSDAPSARAFAWFLRNVGSDLVEFRHEGRCGRCGRPLTTPESIESGLGPVCRAA